MRKIQREKKTVEAMIKIYCNNLHFTVGALCKECEDLLNYAYVRLAACPFKENKPTCAQCTVHCYAPSMRQAIKAVMKYSGPRMLLAHPILALRHLQNNTKSRKRASSG